VATQESGERAAQPSEAAVAASIVSEFVEIGFTELRRLYERARDPESTWRAEDVVGEASATLERMLPVIERSVDLGLALLRPWSAAFQSHTNDG